MEQEPRSTIQSALTRSLCLKPRGFKRAAVLGTARTSDRSLESLVYRWRDMGTLRERGKALKEKRV